MARKTLAVVAGTPTPGPWVVGPNVDSQGTLVYVCVLAGKEALCACSVYGKKTGSAASKPTFTEAEALANARLIAAAPDMLAALHMLASFKQTGISAHDSVFTDLLAVIAKATA